MEAKECLDPEHVSPLGDTVGRKMKSLETQMEKQQNNLKEGQREKGAPEQVPG